MVSKIAVIALVAIVATPILLGYGLNIETNSYTDWVEDGDSINVTNYLYNVVDASKRSYTEADIYQLNSNVFYQYSSQPHPVYTVSTTRTPVKITQVYEHNSTAFGGWLTFGSLTVVGTYDVSNYYNAIVLFTDNTTQTYPHLKSLSYINESGVGSIEMSIMEPGDTIDAGYDFTNVSTVTFEAVGYPSAWVQYDNDSLPYYADISKGYILNADMNPFTAPIPNISTYSGYGITSIAPNGICKDILLTFNLDSITQSSYYLGLRFPSHNDITISLQKRTTGSGVEWFYKTIGDNEEHMLYYDPNLASNTYQLYLNENTGGEFRYVGPWSDSICPAPALLTYPFEYVYGGAGGLDYITRIDVWGQTPIMRMDYAQVAAYEYKIIQDTTYDPSAFKQNPLTKITNMAEWGTSIVFGGNTYNVTNGNITINSREVSVRNLELSSVFNGSGYDNMINGIVVSTTLMPSNITFNGDWSVSVSTVAQKSVVKEETKWIPGKFAWNGVDTDFKLVGLFACVGAFIGLGVYAKGKGVSIWPLIIICVGAGMMFFFMI